MSARENYVEIADEFIGGVFDDDALEIDAGEGGDGLGWVSSLITSVGNLATTAVAGRNERKALSKQLDMVRAGTMSAQAAYAGQASPVGTVGQVSGFQMLPLQPVNAFERYKVPILAAGGLLAALILVKVMKA